MSTPSVPPKFIPPVSAKLRPAEMVIHLRQLYSTINQHDQAIIQVNNKITAASTAANVSTDADVTGVTSFNAKTGDISFFPNLGEVNHQTGVTAYTVTATDDGRMVLFNDASPIAVALDSTITTPWFTVIFNQGAGTATLTPTTGLINGAASLPVSGNNFSIVFFDGVNWFGSISSAGAAPNFADEEIPGGAIDGVNVTFTLAHSPSPAKSLILSLAGEIQWQDALGDYTLSGGTITFATAPAVGPLLAWYRY